MGIAVGLRSAKNGLLHRTKSDLESFGYMIAADTVTPTLQLLFLVCGQKTTIRRQACLCHGRAGVSVTPFR